MSDTKLLPCPFCGVDPVMRGTDDAFSVVCDSSTCPCYAVKTPVFCHTVTARMAWNTRATDDLAEVLKEYIFASEALAMACLNNEVSTPKTWHESNVLGQAIADTGERMQAAEVKARAVLAERGML